jgi:hypothetical protein
MKPRVFIGSSAEAADIAHAVQENLEHDALCRVWDQGVFKLSGNTLDNLLNAVRDYDFAVFVFQLDDIVQIRNQAMRAARDNVVFEFGLFIGGLGKERVFYLVPKKSVNMHLPTDIIGVTPGNYEPQDKPEDLLSALGPFCNRVRRQIKEITSKEVPSRRSQAVEKPNLENEAAGTDEKLEGGHQTRFVEDGVQIDEFSNYTITIKASVFFDNRVSRAFPGARGVCWFADAAEAIKRLFLLLKAPTVFDMATGHNVMTDPIWWFRGVSSMPINIFRQLGHNRCLMDVYELEINRVAVYRSRNYKRSFVYIEACPDQPSGLYDTDAKKVEQSVAKCGYAAEEYAVFQGTLVSRACFDDGAAEIDGEIVDVGGAEVRVRYLSPYNFVIAPKFSAFNLPRCESDVYTLLNDMMRDQATLDDLVAFVETACHHPGD